jgi:hypothetical protein
MFFGSGVLDLGPVNLSDEQTSAYPAAPGNGACRLRERYRLCLKEEIAQTVASPAEAEEELRHLFRVLSR